MTMTISSEHDDEAAAREPVVPCQHAARPPRHDIDGGSHARPTSMIIQVVDPIKLPKSIRKDPVQEHEDEQDAALLEEVSEVWSGTDRDEHADAEDWSSEVVTDIESSDLEGKVVHKESLIELGESLLANLRGRTKPVRSSSVFSWDIQEADTEEPDEVALAAKGSMNDESASWFSGWPSLLERVGEDHQQKKITKDGQAREDEASDWEHHDVWRRAPVWSRARCASWPMEGSLTDRPESKARCSSYEWDAEHDQRIKARLGGSFEWGQEQQRFKTRPQEADGAGLSAFHLAASRSVDQFVPVNSLEELAQVMSFTETASSGEVPEPGKLHFSYGEGGSMHLAYKQKASSHPVRKSSWEWDLERDAAKRSAAMEAIDTCWEMAGTDTGFQSYRRVSSFRWGRWGKRERRWNRRLQRLFWESCNFCVVSRTCLR